MLPTMVTDPNPAALNVLPGEYRQIYDRLLEVATADARVVRVWLSGSLGRGAVDAGSDLDVVLAINELDFEEFTADWREWLARVTPTVLARELPGRPGSWYSVTPDCARFDAVVVPARARDADRPLGRRLVYDRDAEVLDAPASDAAAAGEAEADPGTGPDPQRLAGVVEEFLRQQAGFAPSVVSRGDWLLGVVAIEQVQLMLYQLFVESNQPLPKSGVKQWSAKLTATQRHLCAELPVPRAERYEVLNAMFASASAFRAEAVAILAANSVAWPEALDTAVREHQARVLGWRFPAAV